MSDSQNQETPPTPQNNTLFQAFEWNVPTSSPDSPSHWSRLASALPELHSIGISAFWLPPGCKASQPKGNGYDIYDLWDLGEFDQKGSRNTKWGSKGELQELCKIAKEEGVGIYWDAVLNHKAAADKIEKCKAVEVADDDRNKQISEPYTISAWLGFDFPGRGTKYSNMKYHWYHFSGTDWNAENEKKAIYKIVNEGKGWSESVDEEQGNADYLMFADVDFSHPEVKEDVKNWGVWITKELGLSGFRLDAVQHFSQNFTNEWIEHLRSECGNDIFFVGEFWVGDVETMKAWIANLNHHFSLFDSPLLNNFSQISTTEEADLRQVFDGTLVRDMPTNAVTVVMNHDTQLGQTVETPVTGWFKPLAYALILLRNEGYPCVFFGDMYGMGGKDPEGPSCGGKLADLIMARNLYAYGEQEDYFSEKNCIGFVRLGTWDRRFGLAVVMSNSGPGEIKMKVGEMHKGERWTDVLGWEDGEVVIDEEGCGLFKCPGVSVSVWVNAEAEGRDRFPTEFEGKMYEG